MLILNEQCFQPERYLGSVLERSSPTQLCNSSNPFLHWPRFWMTGFWEDCRCIPEFPGKVSPDLASGSCWIFARGGWFLILMSEKLGFHGKTWVLDWTAFLSSSHSISQISNHILPAANLKWELQKSFSSRHSSWHVSSQGWLTFMAWRLNILGCRSSGQGHSLHFARQASTEKSESLSLEVCNLSRPNLS